MSMPRHSIALILVGLLSPTMPLGPLARAEEPVADPGARACEYGITLALSGEGATAESIFVSLLSRSPGDPRALNNLGNLRLWRGDADVALAFYARAEEADSADPGIALNEATALLIAGEEEDANARAAEGVRRAGGPEEAARLLGLRYEGDDSEAARASDRVQVSRDEVIALLRAATRAVPADSARAKQAAAGPGAKGRKPIPAWRSAGARGAAGSDAAAVVYWKR